MFPSSSNSVSKALLGEQLEAYQDILTFGLEQQSEHMLQILKSSRLKEKVVEHFDLMNHYKLSDSKYKYTKLDRQYESNIKFRRNEYMAIEINVLDEDPQIASNMANFIANLYDSTKNDIQKDRAIKAFEIVERELNKMQSYIRNLEDSLTTLRLLGVHDYESQSEALTRQLAIEIAKNNKNSIKAIENKLNTLAKHGSAYVSLRDALEFESEKLSVIKTKYDEAKVDATEVLPQKFIVDFANPAERKAYPVRWLIILTTLFSTLLISIFTLIIVERYKDWKDEIS